jgi:hypothetical protein
MVNMPVNAAVSNGVNIGCTKRDLLVSSTSLSSHTNDPLIENRKANNDASNLEGFGYISIPRDSRQISDMDILTILFGCKQGHARKVTTQNKVTGSRF